MSPKVLGPIPLFHPLTPVDVVSGSQKLVRGFDPRTLFLPAECLERTLESR